MNRLDDAALSSLAPDVERPSYDRSAVSTGIVHLGIGAFHRAHQADYTEVALGGGDLRWGILGVSLRSAATRDALAPQDNLYTLAVRDGSGERLRVVGASTGVMVAPENPAALIRALADPKIRIASLTVTEKGYCHDPATGDLDESHPDIRYDLANPSAPRSVIGFLAEAIERRRVTGLPPLTLLSCDNLPSNGRVLGNVLNAFARRRSICLANYITDSIACPSTMVDRIVPATTDEDRAAISGRLGREDAWPVVTEPFSQWVIEDNFASGRPEWERAGATFVSDVAPYEMMKLRLLNGSHSTIAYLGFLAGHETVAAALAAPGFADLIAAMMEEEISPTLPPLPGMDLPAYRQDLLRRFRNPALRHRTAQIAMDGSQKLPQRLLETVRSRIEASQPFPRLALAIAGWMRYARGTDEAGRPIEVRDPLADLIRERVGKATTARDYVEAFLGIRQIFGTEFAAVPIFRETLEAAMTALLERGAAEAVARLARA